MIIGYGIDIVEIDRLKKAYDRFGPAFLAKILADEELISMPEILFPWLGGRFAAKESASKALGSGFSNGITARDFIVRGTPGGRPELVFMDRARELADQLKVRVIRLSISHEKHYAIAGVILED